MEVGVRKGVTNFRVSCEIGGLLAEMGPKGMRGNMLRKAGGRSCFFLSLVASFVLCFFPSSFLDFAWSSFLDP